MNNYLLTHPEVIEFIKKNENPGIKSKAIFSVFNGTTEKLAKELSLEICLPGSKLKNYVDNKTNTTFITERAGVSCVSNVITKVNSYPHLMPLSSSLGTGLVIQIPFG